ncbi:DUF4224 domain-containing protein [Aquariibacter albus]|uniref:DUF4224 domain-containing protein n=1 Tax=Aquariibacter albus TaxID=2759899 RepID=A0A839HQ06_9BURK|nr:DUF4224 domain-containing protein [Aquariibacter albus]MBB1161510.1 DUF4224 domain-containing protein [Aquariibacter albus]
MSPAGLLTHADLVALTGYRQHAAQAKWIKAHLGLHAPRRGIDGLPVLTWAAVERAQGGRPAAGQQAAGPKWSRAA